MPAETAAVVPQATWTIDADKFALVVTLPNQDVEIYPVDHVPAENSTLVVAALQDILADLDLHEMIANLSRVSDMLFLAYMGVAGQRDIWAEISKRRATFLGVCNLCVEAMTEFETTGAAISRNVAEGFHWIVRGQEPRGLAALERSVQRATQMADQAKTLADQFDALQQAVQQDQYNAQQLTADEGTKLEQIRLEHEAMKAALAVDKQTATDLTDSIAGLQVLYDDAKSREESANKRAMITGIVSGLTGALGSAFGAYTAAKNPLGTMAAGYARGQEQGQNPSNPDRGAGDEQGHASGSAGPTPAQTARVDAARKSYETADAAYRSAEEEFDAKEAVKNQAEQEASAALGDAVTALHAARKTRDKARTAKADAAAQLTRAEDEAKPVGTAGSAAAAAGLNSAAASAQTMSDTAASAADSIRDEKLKLLEQKLGQEAQKRKVAGEIAGLAEKLTASDTERQIHESAQAALQIAVWSFSNIVATLVLTEGFWRRIASTCQTLANSELRAKIQEEIASGDEAEDRKAFYLSEMFLPQAVCFLMRWTALKSLGGQYRIAATAARDQTAENIRAAPTIEESRTMLIPLKTKLIDAMEDDKAKSMLRSDAVKSEIGLLSDSAFAG